MGDINQLSTILISTIYSAIEDELITLTEGEKIRGLFAEASHYGDEGKKLIDQATLELRCHTAQLAPELKQKDYAIFKDVSLSIPKDWIARCDKRPTRYGNPLQGLSVDQVQQVVLDNIVKIQEIFKRLIKVLS